MIDRRATLFSGLLILAMTVAGLASWSVLPADQQIPVHFDADGTADNWMPPWKALLFMPAIATLIWGFFIALRLLDPNRTEKPAKAEAMIFHAPNFLLACAQAFIISRAFGVSWTSPKLILAGLALMWVVLGNVMGKLPPNNAFGVRTPWTLADPHIWDQTNRFGGRMIVLAGLGGFIVVLTMEPGWPMLIALVALNAIAVLSSVAKSWLLWRESHPQEGLLPRTSSRLPLAVSALALAAIVADLALEHGRSELPIALCCLAAALGARYLQYRR